MGFLIGIAFLYWHVPVQHEFVCCVLRAACNFEVPFCMLLEHNS